VGPRHKQVTADGVKDNSYVLDNAGWVTTDRVIVKIATFQQDQRSVGEMYLVETKVGHRVLHAWKYPPPGDETVAMIRRVTTLCADSGCGVDPGFEPTGFRFHLARPQAGNAAHRQRGGRRGARCDGSARSDAIWLRAGKGELAVSAYVQ
jgi:hypothetical protein